MRRLALAPLLASVAASAYAHSGHGAQQASHWHASDTMGFLMVAALVALVIWLSRGD